jgi:hypothetical protein
MHLAGYPKYFVKDGKRRAVYFTGEVRDLIAMGWRPEGRPKPERKIQPEPEPEPEPVAQTEEVIVEIQVEGATEKPAFEFMTKAELIKYAKDRGVELQQTSLKAEMIEACEAL